MSFRISVFHIRVIIFILLSLVPASYAQDSQANREHKRAMAIFFEGKNLYESERFAAAAELFKRSAKAFADASFHSTDQAFVKQEDENEALLKRWTTLSYCHDHLGSEDVDDLKDLVGLSEYPSFEYSKACLQFPEFPELADYVHARIKFLTTGQGSNRPAPKVTLGGGGHWFVIAGAWSDSQKIDARMALLKRSGISAHVINTDDYPNLTPGLKAVVLGPSSKDEAQSQLDIVQSVVPDAFIKRGN